MSYFLFLICIITLVIEANTYILLQVRKKDGNHSNIDAIIHKVVPAGKFDEIAKQLTVRKQFTDSNNYEMRAKNDNNVRRNEERLVDNAKESIESNTNESEEVSEKPVSNILSAKSIEKALFDLAKNYSKAVFRANTKHFDIKPEVIHFRNEKPSIIYEINSKTLMRAINNFLSSKIFTDSVDSLTQKAAVVYRSLRRKM